MSNRNFRLTKIDVEFDRILARKSQLLGGIGKRQVTQRLATPEFEKIIDMQLSKETKKLFRIR